MVSGSTNIMRTVCDGSRKYKGRQEVVERPGKVLCLDENGRKWIFDSPDRGVVEYNLETKKFLDVSPNNGRIPFHTYVYPPLHVGFGTVDLSIDFRKKTEFTTLLQKVFQ